MYKDLLNIDGNVKKIQRETLTPYKIAVVILIKEYCLETTKAIVKRRDFCLASLKLIQSPDMELSTLLTTLHSSEYTLDRIANRLEFSLNVLCEEGIEKLLDLIDNIGQLMKAGPDHPSSSPALNKNSVLGIYVRRIIIFFEKLQFDQVVLLYESLKQFVERKSVDPKESSNFSISLKEIELTQKYTNIWGGRQAELLVAQQAHALQTDEHKAMSPKELQNLVQELLNCSPCYAEAHYLSYLNCLRVNEYCGALDSLYHCFDRLVPLENRFVSEDRSRTFRYAALNLAVLHAQFDHKDVAKSALREAIMMAQEAGDNVCLQLAHAWIYHLTNEKKGPLIERSVGKASMLGITHTTGLGLIAYAHNSALEAKNPSQVFEILMKSDVLNCQHSMTDLMSMTYTEKSALWAYYGKTEMSSICSQLLLLHNAGDKKQHMFNGPLTCQAVVNIANTLVEFGEHNLVDIVLTHAKQRFPNEPCNKIWMLSEQLYTFTQSMRQEKWNEAEAIALNISSLDPLESKFRQVEVYLAKCDYPKALEVIESIEKTDKLTPNHKIRCMILTSQIMCTSVFSNNGTAGINSLVLLNSALELASQNHLSYYEALVKMHLANIQLIMDMPVLAMNILEEAIITILAHGGCYDQGRALVLYAKCLTASARFIHNQSKRQVITNAIKALDKAKVSFNKINACGKVRTVLCLKAMLYNEMDMKSERNQCAYEFRQINEQLCTSLDNVLLY